MLHNTTLTIGTIFHGFPGWATVRAKQNKVFAKTQSSLSSSVGKSWHTKGREGDTSAKGYLLPTQRPTPVYLRVRRSKFGDKGCFMKGWIGKDQRVPDEKESLRFCNDSWHNSWRGRSKNAPPLQLKSGSTQQDIRDTSSCGMLVQCTLVRVSFPFRRKPK